jgi:AcrR family transcriptional regulator
LSPDARREQLLVIGARHFAEKPSEDIGIEQIAESAGVSRGLIYHYFPTKQDFHAAIVRFGIEQSLRRTQPERDLPPLESLRMGIDRFIGFVEENETAFRAVNRGQQSVDELVRAEIRVGRNAQIERIASAILPSSEIPEILRTAIEGWIHFNNNVILEWLDGASIDRDQLIDLLAGALLGACRSALAIEGGSSAVTAVGGAEDAPLTGILGQ